MCLIHCFIVWKGSLTRVFINKFLSFTIRMPVTGITKINDVPAKCMLESRERNVCIFVLLLPPKFSHFEGLVLVYWQICWGLEIMLGLRFHTLNVEGRLKLLKNFCDHFKHQNVIFLLPTQ